ncbi:TrkH family potassium uptake protein [Ectobacillus antri]|uniref:TrkH family potassium uptake protein n=1 Tax=Ectobacillus antri TaxID=2486280 RepID=UPI0013DDCE0E|nr:potassium transporter TrkG [Ectobacillus antri]
MADKLRGRKLSAVQLIVLFYLIAVAIGTLLLCLPGSLKPGVELSVIDALFTAVSAISVTGLTVVSTVDTFSHTGYFFLLVMFQLGGIGIMTLGTSIWLMLGKRIGFKERQLIRADQNQSGLAGLVQLMRQILLLILSIQAVGALVLSLYYLKYYSWKQAILHGVFSSISATTNAGFDITGESLISYQHDYFIQFVHILLIISGAIGFPVLIEVKSYLTHKGKQPYRFSLFSKLTTATYFLLTLAGTIGIYILEHNRFLADKTWHASLFYALFHSTSTRSAGLATVDLNEFSESTQVFLSFLMFLGASPSSVGGGIRTTTFAIVVLSIFFYAQGRDTIKVFKREIDPKDVHRAFIVITTAFFIYSGSVFVMSYLEPSVHIVKLLFEVASAFGTTGLSLGITGELSTAGKLLLTVLMFIGRIGIFSLLFLVRNKVLREAYHYPIEKVIIG